MDWMLRFWTKRSGSGACPNSPCPIRWCGLWW